MSSIYHQGNRDMQERFDTRRIADRIEQVLDTVAFPNFDGNGMYLTTGDVLVNPSVGLLFIDFERGHRTRLNGVASIDPNDPLMAEHAEAQFIARVRAREVFPNCPRYIHRYKLVERSRFVPKKGVATPVPAWKCADWSADALPAADPARDHDREVL